MSQIVCSSCVCGASRTNLAFSPRLPGRQQILFAGPGRVSQRRQRSSICVRAQTDTEVGTAPTAFAVSGLVASPVVLASCWALKTTGEGLPPGPGGIFGALEGISYLQLLGLLGWSIYTKVKTGKGLPAGPSGLIGAAEGLSYLTVVVAVGVFGFELITKGSLPGPTGR